MSTNISKQKRDELIKKISEIKKFIAKSELDENTKNLISYMSELEKEIKSKKYGLIFEEHRESIDDLLETNLPVLVENKELFINNGGQVNFLIEGDNLSALKLLEKTHKGKIDLIYIDPPYNTGEKDFIYDDDYVDKNDGYRHSKWLSFISKRLNIAKKLISQKGFIFISIDDKEASQLKILCDSIFGENNFENTNYIQVRYPEKTLKQDMSYHKQIEQVLIYRKSFSAKPFLQPVSYDYDKFIFSIDELSDGKEIILGGKKVKVLQKNEYKIIKSLMGYKDGLKEIWASGTILNGNSSGRFFRDYIEARKEIDGLGVMYKVYGIGDDKYDYRYFTGPKQQKATRGKYYQGVPIDKLSDDSNKISPIQNFYDMAGDFGNIRHEGGVSFNSGKKPIKLISYFIDYFENKNITVLDFFAGSGSTGHAVIAKNEDGGNRKYILVTNNENCICREITYKRISNVIKEFDNNSSLKYFKVDYVPIDDKLYYEYADRLLLHIKELVELENNINFTDNKKVAIILTNEELSYFVENIENSKKVKKIYLGHNVLKSSEYETLFKAKRIKVNIIPNYYYKELEG